jgi:hypothetical protein
MRTLMSTHYVAASMLYSFGRKVAELRDARYTSYKYDPRRVDSTYPMLLADKVIIAAVCTVAAPYIAPYYLYRDLVKLELMQRGDESLVSHYRSSETPKASALDYIYS